MCLPNGRVPFGGSLAWLTSCFSFSDKRVCPAYFGADADRYSFIARELHPLLLADLPALRRMLSALPTISTVENRHLDASDRHRRVANRLEIRQHSPLVL